VVHRLPEPGTETPPALIKVDETTAALARAGTHVRRKLERSRWFAITGSNGKTTTKELLAAGLSNGRRVHRTEGNLNNHLGVPLTLLHCPADAECVVVELAMSGPGEIGMLGRIVDPDVGLITNVRAVHLAFFSSLDDIAAAKGELFAIMRDDAVAVVNLDDPHVRLQATRHAGSRVTFGRAEEADLRMGQVAARFEGTSFTFRHRDEEHRVQLKIGGAHGAYDALAALAAVAAAGEPLARAIEGMQTVESGAGRGKVHHLARDLTLVDDSYNSSPAALASVLETLRNSRPAGRRVLVMGDMLELGNVEGALHREAGKRAAANGVDMLVAVGPLSRQSAESARRAGVPEVHLYPDAKQCAGSLAEYIRDGDLLVVKGSRGMRMEQVVAALLAEFKVVEA
jgi:UDP-N-acetylmuramoyl-tripeptide--D-alanyl-D-alanine ligase